MEYLHLLFLLIVVFVLVFFYQKLLKSRKKPILKILPLSFLLIPLWIFTNQNNPIEGDRLLNPIGDFVKENVQKKSIELEEIVQNELENASGTYSVAIKNLKTNEYYFYNERRQFETASLYKLWVMGAVFEEIEKGNINKAQNIGFEAEDINKRLDIATESAEITEGFVGDSVENALERMITISDNYSAHILYLTVGWSKIKNFLNYYEFNDSSADLPILTTSSDMLAFFEKLYQGDIVEKEASGEMLEILKRQQLNDRIPKYLPQNTQIAHKTGELGGLKHDAGIVFSEKGDYIIVLLSETNNQSDAAEIEAKVSKKVWDYFNQ